MKSFIRQLAAAAVFVVALTVVDRVTAQTPPPPGTGAPPAGSAPAASKMSPEDLEKLRQLREVRGDEVLKPVPNGQTAPYRFVAGITETSPCAPGDDVIESKYDKVTNQTFHRCRHRK